MRGAVMHGPGDVRIEECPEPQILKATDAIIRLPATCICGSDLWPYWGIEALDGPRPMGHEYVGIMEEVGSAVTTIRPGQFVVGSFWASDTPARSAGPDTSPPVSSAWAWARPRPSGCGSPWPRAPSSPHRRSRKRT